MAISFDDASSATVIKDIRSSRQLSPQSLLFLTLSDETVINATDFNLKHVEKQGNRPKSMLRRLKTVA